MSKTKSKTLAEAENAIRAKAGKTATSVPADHSETAKTSKKAAVAAPAETKEPESIHNLVGDVDGGGSSKHVLCGTVEMADLATVEGYNPRTSLGVLDELAASIKSEGLLSALVVRPAADNETGKYLIVSGHRRFAALQLIGYAKPVPVIIRADLTDDPMRAKAVSVAENSEDGRINLNSIEIGRVAKELTDGGWSIERIAKEMALHPQKVRRALKVVDLPQDVQSLVSSDKLAANAALEYAKLDDSTRASISAELHQGMTIEDIKALRKKAEIKAAQESNENEPDSEGGAGGETGDPIEKAPLARGSKPTLGVWRGSRVKQEQIDELAKVLANASEEDKETQDYYEVRGALAALLWDRGDLDSIMLPASDTTDTKEKKILKVFDAVVKSAKGK